MTPEELKAIEARIRADDATAEDMRALLAYVKEDLLTKLETRLAAAEKVVEAARDLALEDAFLGGTPLTPDQAIAFRLKVAPLIAEFDKLKEEK